MYGMYPYPYYNCGTNDNNGFGCWWAILIVIFIIFFVFNGNNNNCNHCDR